MKRIKINNGHVICPKNQFDKKTNVYIADGKILALADSLADFTPDHEIDASNLIVCPGLIDLWANLREPGFTYKATINSERLAAVSAGITTLCMSPATNPAIDNVPVVELIKRRVSAKKRAKVAPIAALTMNLEGQLLSPMVNLHQAGCVAVSNAEIPVKDTCVLRHSFDYAATHRLPIIIVPQDPWLSKGSVAHEGEVATRLGLVAEPVASECIEIARCIELTKLTKATVHFAKVSSQAGLALIQQAQNDGVPVSASVSTQHLFLNANDLSEFSSLYHVIPPLRSADDQEALLAGVKEQHFSAICSDHQPHEADAKLAPLSESAPGVSSLETLLPLCLRLHQEHGLSLSQALYYVTDGPAKCLGIDAGHLSEGSAADLCLFDPNANWVVRKDNLVSRGKFTPFTNWPMQGKVHSTIVDGRVVFE